MGKILALLLVPAASLFAFSLPSLSIPGLGSNATPFGGKISSTDSCFCPDEPEKMGWEQVEYGTFWEGGKRNDGKTLFYKPGITKLYDKEKIADGVWNLGKFNNGSDECKYVTDEDWAEAAAEALAGDPQPPKCSGTLSADGTINYTGTNGGGGLLSSFGF